MKHKALVIAFIITAIPVKGFTADAIRVVTTTADLADLVSAVGGELVTVQSLSQGSQDPHQVEPRPSMVMQVRRADMLVRIGMDQDLWAQSLIDAARNSKVAYGGEGYLDVSSRIDKLQVPTGSVDMRMGDIHIFGNPHYWLDPMNARIILEDIAGKLGELIPSETDLFRRNAEEYATRINTAIVEWQQAMQPFAGTKIVTYHNSWIYFAERFDLDIAGYIEVKPGIPPTPSHVAELVELMNTEGVRVVMIEPYYNVRIAESIADRTDAEVLIVPSSAGGAEGVDSYMRLFEYIINQLVETLSDQGV